MIKTKTFLWLILAFACFGLSLQAVTIYEIQYTTNPGSGTYPSPYVNQDVTTEGIVVARGYSNNNGFFISMPEGGAYKGVFVYNSAFQPNPGDLVQVSGTVVEYYGWTEINDVTSVQTLSTGNPLPPATLITTGEANTEAYESVFVEVRDVSVYSALNGYAEWAVTDGSQNVIIAGGFFNQSNLSSDIFPGNAFESIKGLINFAYNAFRINPRSANDVVQSAESIVLSFPNIEVNLGSPAMVPLTVSNLTLDNNFTSYSFRLFYNPAVISYSGHQSNGTISAGGNISTNQSSGVVDITYSGTSILQGQGDLIRFNFNSISAGLSTITAQNFVFNSTPMPNVLAGSVRVNAGYNSIGDTLTIIQRPILNIPEIVIPGETMTITCLAPSNTNSWQANLKHGNKTVPLQVMDAQYVSTPNRWLIDTLIPQVPVFELYDLEVTASGGIQDITRNAVQVIPSRRESYYFVHITDIHLPGRTFYPDAGYDADSTSVMDFRAVMEDINIIRPEFVLITGDLVNEGELENFAGMYSYGWAQKLLSEMEVPFYLTSGNHDIGGWDSTPAPQGSARRNWWRYFGWSWLDNPNYSWGNHHQDYYFHYGNTHYIGLESYDNYDSWRYMIYGAQSYTPNQLSWLNSTLNLFPEYRKVLFHHYDFSSQLDLTALGIDLSLWGHIHSNSGSISTYPYDLSTRSVCDGNRAYRIIRMSNNNIMPQNTIYAGSTGSNISQTFYPNNYGVVDSVRAVITNSQLITFDNAVIKFLMPSGSDSYTVWGGTLEQVDRSGPKNVCYVRINLNANTTMPVSIKANPTSLEDAVQLPAPVLIKDVYPNPFRNTATIRYELSKSSSATLTVYNLKGALVREIQQSSASAGENHLLWDGFDSNGLSAPTGVYFLRLTASGKSNTRKILKIK